MKNWIKHGDLPSLKTNRAPLKMVVGRLLYLLSYWEGNFSVPMLNFGVVIAATFCKMVERETPHFIVANRALLVD